MLRSEAGFDAWRARWASAEAAARRVLAAAIADDLRAPRHFRALVGLERVRFPGALVDGGGWAPAALRLGPRDELWVFTDDAAVAACRREVGGERLGPIAPPAALAPIVAELPAELGAVWINPFDDAGGLVIEGAQLRELIAWARRVLVEAAARARGAAALVDAGDLALAVVDGQLVTEVDRAGEWLAIFTAPDAQAAFAARVPRGEPIAFVHLRGAELRARVSEIRTDHPRLAGFAINPAGPSAIARVALPAGW
jgi:hypothetical protein